MATGSHLTDRIAGVLPDWMAWPASALSTLFGFVGAGLILWAATYGHIAAAIWSAGSFVLAGILWHVAELAAHRS